MRIGWKPKVKARGAVPEMQELKRPPCAEKGKLAHSHHYSDKPPYAERHVRWCERTVREIIPYFLLDVCQAWICAIG
jgi:hypothetical protein